MEGRKMPSAFGGVAAIAAVDKNKRKIKVIRDIGQRS
jgi:hypothetical protein